MTQVRGEEKCLRVLEENLKEKDYLEGVVVEGRIILKLILRGWGG